MKQLLQFNKDEFKFALAIILFYYVLAVLFNIVSLISMQLGGEPLIKGNPIASIVLLTLFLVLVLCGYKGWRWPFLVIGLFGLLALPIRGIIPHIQALLTPELLINYASESTIWVAILINCLGFVALLLSFYTSPFFREIKEPL